MVEKKIETKKENNQTLQEKLNAAMGDMKTPQKTAQMKYGNRNFMYATLDSVMKEVKTALKKQGLTLFQYVKYKSSVAEAINGNTENLFFLLYTVVSDGKEEHILDIRPLTFQGTPQQNGAEETYYKRYALNTAFCLTGEADTDGNSEQPQQQQTKVNPNTQQYEPQVMGLM